MAEKRTTKKTQTQLSKFLETKKRETRLIGPIERHLLARTPEHRPQDVLHPSDLIKKEWCALHAYHALKGNYVSTSDTPNLRLQSIFDEGHAIHAKWQAWISEMGNMYGRWECHTCGYVSSNTITPCCPLHGIEAKFTYKEVNLVSAKHKIFGHTDGWVKGIGEDFLIEIKSIGTGTIRFEQPSLLAQADGDLEKAWRSIRQPFYTHRLQGQMYLHLTHLMVEEGLLESAPDEIVFLYELKANQDYKEFAVKYDSEFVAPFFEAALDVSWAVDNNMPPACNIDPVNGCKRCATLRTEEEVNE
jgi:hypothetical protein